MSSEGLISVVVPVYGVEDYIEQCIDSLLSQRHRAIEVIVVDDGSVDRSGEIADRCAGVDRRLRVVHKPNGGLVSARKAGVAVATGEYLGFVDGDDWVASDFLEFLYQHAAAADADLVVCGHVREFLGKQEVVLPRSPAGVYDRAGVVEALLPKAIYNGVFFQHGVSTYVWNKLFRRSDAAHFVQEIDEDIVMGEDAALTYPYLAGCERVVVAGQGGYFYRQRSNSIVKSVPDINKEYYRLSALFRYLQRRCHAYPPNVLDQLRHYFYAQVLIRSGAVLETAQPPGYWSAFPQLAANMRAVVFSSGSFGQHLVSALARLGKFELAGWIDDDDHESQRCGLPVRSLDAVTDLEFDIVLIAAIDGEYGEAVAQRLVAMGVDRSKISLVQPDFRQLDRQLRALGFDLDTFGFSPQA